MKSACWSLLFLFGLVACSTNETPFKGVWISDSEEEYYQLKIDLYEKSVFFSEEIGTVYGYMQQENEFSADYWLITDVTSIEGDEAKVKVYSFRYGDANQKDTATLRWSPALQKIVFRQTAFGPEEKCNYVEIAENKTHILTEPKSGATVMEASLATIFPILDLSGGWYKVALEDGGEGYLEEKLGKPVISDSIPASAWKGLYSGKFEDEEALAGLSFSPKGNEMIAMIEHYSMGMGGLPDYGTTTFYRLRVEGNKIVLTHAVDVFMGLVENIDLKEYEALEEPIIVYYSVAEKMFVINGEPFKE